MSRNPVILNVKHHCQNPLDSIMDVEYYKKQHLYLHKIAEENHEILIKLATLLIGAMCENLKLKTKTKLHGLSPRANYTNRATTTCRQT
jgi:hypothetical protein